MGEKDSKRPGMRWIRAAAIGAIVLGCLIAVVFLLSPNDRIAGAGMSSLRLDQIPFDGAKAYLWNEGSAPRNIAPLNGHEQPIASVIFTTDGSALATASVDGTVKLWETQEGRQTRSWTAHSSGALCVNFAHDGRLVTCGRDLAVTLWNTNGGKLRNLELAGDLPLRAAFSYDDKRVFATDFAGRVMAWTADDGKRAGELDANARILQVVQAVDAQIGNAAQVQRASTDANIPLSLGREAIAIGGGGSGGGAHTLQEWFDCTGRDQGLKRILLTLLALTGVNP